MEPIDVECRLEAGGGWNCHVTLGNLAGDRWTYRVRVGRGDLERLAPGATDPMALVTASFAFLLERESPASILGSFALTEIGRYFPEYEPEIGRRVAS